MNKQITIGKYYKVGNKIAGRTSTGEERIFEKKDYAFEVTGIIENSIQVCYQGTDYYFDKIQASNNFNESLTSKDIEEYIILKYITGSKMYGTNVETSDTDYKAVFVMPDEWYGRIDFRPEWEEISEKNHYNNSETTYLSLKKFVSLLAANNPNMLEVFDIPYDCLIFKHHAIAYLLKAERFFLSKLSHKVFLGYGASQIKKADGQDKLNNWEKEDMQRKTPLDFCFVPNMQGSFAVEHWLGHNHMDQRFVGLNTIDHMKDMYSLYYDNLAHTIVYLKEIIAGERDIDELKNNKICFNTLANLNHGFTLRFIDNAQRTLEWVQTYSTEKMLGYKGIVLDDSNTIRLSETPKDAVPITYMSYNKDGYMSHCKLYNRYMTWKRERNDSRWTDVEGHQQKIDGKNMLHCMRLIYMSQDIAEGRGIIVRRPESEYLKSIRYGKVDLATLIDTANAKLVDLEGMFESADLPDEPNYQNVLDFYNATRGMYWDDYKNEKDFIYLKDYINKSNKPMIEDLLIKHLGNSGRIICDSQTAYIEQNPNNAIVFNATVIASPRGLDEFQNVWDGDLNMTIDEDILNLIASETESDIFILQDVSDLYDYAPDDIVRNHVFNTSGKMNIGYMHQRYYTRNESGRIVKRS